MCCGIQYSLQLIVIVFVVLVTSVYILRSHTLILILILIMLLSRKCLKISRKRVNQQHNKTKTRRMAIANGTCVSFCNQPKAHYLATSRESRRYAVCECRPAFG